MARESLGRPAAAFAVAVGLIAGGMIGVRAVLDQAATVLGAAVAILVGLLF